MIKLVMSWIICLSCLTACATTHPDCERADAFGHCKQWKNQPQPCKNPDFLGFCPPARN